MLELIIPIEVSDDVSEHLQLLVAEIAKAHARKVRVYGTYAGYSSESDCSFYFFTTSKDVHLGLGELSGTGQFYLANVLRDEFEAKGDSDSQLLLFSEGKEGGWLITQTEYGVGDIAFTISPAR